MPRRCQILSLPRFQAVFGLRSRALRSSCSFSRTAKTDSAHLATHTPLIPAKAGIRLGLSNRHVSTGSPPSRGRAGDSMQAKHALKRGIRLALSSAGSAPSASRTRRVRFLSETRVAAAVRRPQGSPSARRICARRSRSERRPERSSSSISARGSLRVPDGARY